MASRHSLQGWLIAGSLACGAPLLASAQMPTGSSTPSVGATESPGAEDPALPPHDIEDVGAQVTVTGEIEAAPSREPGQTQVLSLRTDEGSLILRTDPSDHELTQHVGEIFEITGTLRAGAAGADSLLLVESYRPAEKTQSPTPDEGPGDQDESEAPDGRIPPPF